MTGIVRNLPDMQTCDVFISYKREESARVALLAQKLQSVGLKVWFDSQLKAGAAFDEQIADALKSARALLVCWTPGAMASEWVRGEATMARGANKLVSVFLAPTELITPFNLIHTESLTDWTGEDDHAGWAKILARLASTSGEPGLVGWAKMMGEGDARTLRTWIDAQPAGPLRNTTRFWLSEMNARPIFGKDGPPKPGRTRNAGTGRTVGVLALVAVLGAGVYVAMRTKEPAEPVKPDVPPPIATVASSQAKPASPPPSSSVTQSAPVVQSGIVPAPTPAPITIADGTTLHVPLGSLVDFETGRVSADDGPGFDFEITFNGQYRWKSRGAARMQWRPPWETPPNRRELDELPFGEMNETGVFSERPTAAKRYQCFITAEGHRGYIKHLNGYEDPATGVDFTVTFFR